MELALNHRVKEERERERERLDAWLSSLPFLPVVSCISFSLVSLPVSLFLYSVVLLPHLFSFLSFSVSVSLLRIRRPAVLFLFLSQSYKDAWNNMGYTWHERRTHKSSPLFFLLIRGTCILLLSFLECLLSLSPLAFGGEFCMKETRVYVSLVLIEGSGINVTFFFHSSPWMTRR